MFYGEEVKNTVKSSMDVNERKDRISSEVKVKRRLSESSVWTIKITLITLCLAFFVSFGNAVHRNGCVSGFILEQNAFYGDFGVVYGFV